MAKLRIRKDRIFFDFNYRGQRYRLSTGMKADVSSLKLAEVRLRLLESEIVAEQMGGPAVDLSSYFPKFRHPDDERQACELSKKTFALLYGEWLGEQTHISKSTKRAWGSASKNYLLPVLGKIKIDQIRMRHINKIVENMKKKDLKNSTIHKAFVPLKIFLVQMVEDGVLKKNPMKRLKGLRIEKTDIVPFNVRELKKLFRAIQEKFPFFYLFFKLLLLTGCRPSEAVALKWERIDWENKLILIREGRVLGVTTPLKTKSSIRNLEMRPELRELLEQQQEKTKHLESEYVFPNTVGRPICWENVRQKYHAALKVSGVKPRRAYQLRHTFASLALKAGEDIAWVSKTLGHSNMKTTLEKYARFIPSKDRKDGRKFRSILDEKA